MLDCLPWFISEQCELNTPQKVGGPSLPGRHGYGREQTLPQTSDIQTKLCLLVSAGRCRINCLISSEMSDILYLEGDIFFP